MSFMVVVALKKKKIIITIAAPFSIFLGDENQTSWILEFIKKGALVRIVYSHTDEKFRCH